MLTRQGPPGAGGPAGLRGLAPLLGSGLSAARRDCGRISLTLLQFLRLCSWPGAGRDHSDSHLNKL